MSRGRGGKRSLGDKGWGEWRGYMNAKKQKLTEQFTADTPRNIEIAGSSSETRMFDGISIHVNGYTVPSSDELKRLMMLHGGMYYYYYSKTKVTHIIATRLPYAKIKELRDEKIVRPDWIVDSIKAGKLLSDTPYQLYTNRTTSQGTLKFTDTAAKHLPTTPMQGHASEASAGKHTSGDINSGFRDQRTVAHSSNRTQLSQVESRDRVQSPEMCSTDITSPPILNRNSSANVTLSEPQGDNSAHRSINRSPSKPLSVRSHLQPIRDGKGPAKAGDANFVSEFYSNSRLHYISTWGAEFKAFVNTLQSSGNTSFPGREKLRRLGEDRDDSTSGSIESQETINATSTPENRGNLASDTRKFKKIHLGKRNPKMLEKPGRVIMHVDMDCFFVSVGLRNRPDLIGKPVAVTHSRGKGMSEANQETREYEKAYYANKYKQDGGKGLKSRHIDLAKATLQETDKSSRDDTSMFEDTNLPNTSTHSEKYSSTLMSDSGSRGQPTNTMLTGCGQAGPQRAKSETFSSMAEIASCSYEARKAGLRNGMFMGEAKRLCPDLQTIPYDFEGYRKVSQTLYETVASYTHDIEAVSCDEMFVDVTEIVEDTGVTPLHLAQVLREEIKEKTQCNASAGLASNVLLARMSTRKAKPNGQFFLDAKDAVEFMKQQPVKDLPGVGWSTGSRLRTMGIETCEDLQGVLLSALQKEFGPKTGQALYSYCRGIDNRPIKVERERKSVSAEINYGIRFTQNSESETFVSELAAEVHRRLTAIQMVGKTITLKLKVRRAGAPKETSKFMGHGICDNLAKSTTLAQPTDKLEVIQQESKTLLSQMRIEVADLRGVGIQISRLAAAAADSASTSSAAPSNKSLLDFVKPLPPKPAEVVPTTPIVRDPTREQPPKQKSSGTLLNFVSKQKSAVHGNQTQVLPQPKKTPLPPLPSLNPDVSMPSRTSTAREEQEEFCLPSPSQLDPSVLAALPLNIRENIERTYKTQKEQQDRKLQGVPNTSSTISNIVSHSKYPITKPSHKLPSGTALTSANILIHGDKHLQSMTSQSSTHPFSVASYQEETRNTEDNSNDLSNNVQTGDVKTSPVTHPSKSGNNIETSIWDQPGTSYGTARSGRDPDPLSASSGTDNSLLGYDPSVLKELPPDILQEIMGQEHVGSKGRRREAKPAVDLPEEEEEDVLGPVEALPSFSQIDPSCLEALPSDLQKELQLAYQRRHKTSNATSPSRPALKSSPFKLHRRRGRPRKTSPRKGEKQGMVDILEMVTGVKTSPVSKVQSGCNSRTDTNEDPVIETSGSSNTNSSEATKIGKRTPVNLCGAVALWDVKTLLKEWTTSVEEPGNEDIDHLVLYLNELITDRNLEMTDLVLRGMKRLASQMESTSPWRDAYQIIEDRVQDTVSQIYRSKLKLA